MTNDVSAPEAESTSSLQLMIDHFNAQFSTPASMRSFAAAAGASTNTIQRIYVPGAVILEPPHTPSAQIGIGKHLVNSVRGLLIIIQPYQLMSAGDSIEVFMGDARLPVLTLTVQAAQLGQNIEAFIPPNKVLAGLRSLYTTVRRVGSTNKEKSLELSALVRLLLPGGNDPQPDRPGHYNLLPLKLTDLPATRPITEENLVDENGEDIGVRVTLPAYPNMRMYDTVQVSWHGAFVDYVVTPGEEGMEVIIEIASEYVRESDGEQLVVIYRIWDECYNTSSDWSLRFYVDVEVDPDRPQAPEIINPDPEAAEGAPIDLSVLGDEDVTVNVWVYRGNGLKTGDKITLTWAGRTAQGQEVLHVPAPMTVTWTVTGIPRALSFTIPNATVKMLARGSAKASYAVLRSTGPMLNSKSAWVDVVGSDVKLPRPSVAEAVDGILAPTLAMVTVIVPKESQLASGDTLIVNWRGVRPDGSPLTYTASRSVSGAMVGTNVEFKVNGPSYLKPLEGGTLEVSYQVLRDGLPVPLESTPLGLQIGAAQVELPAPLCPEAQDGALDPDTLGDITIEIAPYTDMRIGQTINAQWCDAAGKCYYDQMKVTARNVDKTIVFHVPHADWSTALSGEVEVIYQVVETGKPTRVSAPLALRRAEQQQRLPDPIVIGAINGTLLPNGDATVRIPAAALFKRGDDVDLTWDGDNSRTVITRHILTDQVRDLDITVGAEFVLANIDAEVRVKYVVYRFDGTEQTSGIVTLNIQRTPLPLPVFVEATAGKQLNPDDVRNGATFRIGAAANLLRGDKVTVTLQSPVAAGNFTHTVTVTAGDEKNMLNVTVPYATINASNRSTVTLKYSIQRASGGPVENAPDNTYSISRVIGAGPVRIFGARYGASTYRASGTSRVLSAFNPQTLQPLLAEWRYVGDTAWTAGTTWMDKQPSRALRVRTQSEEVQLNPANIIGNGNDTTVNGSAAFVALRDERGAGVRDMVGWGSAAHGANIPPTLITFDDLVEISCTRSAYAALRANGFVVCWGNTAEGGTMRANETGNFVEVRSNAVAFVGRKSDGRLSAWGTLASGADIPPAIINEAGYIAVYGAGMAFAAQKANGQLVAWGSAANGGTLPADIATLRDVYYVKGNYAAFAGRRTNKRIVAWGNPGYGGTVPAAIAVLIDVESLEGATAQAFSALRSTGQVVAWGAASHGGTVPPEIGGMTDIVEVTSTWHALCARRRNGRVVAWGNPSNGGTVPAAIAQRSDIVQVTGSAWAFAALCTNGTVVAWGRAEAGGDTSRVAAQLNNVRAVYANSNGFTALTSDGRVVTWGQPQGGGDSTAVQPALRGLVTTGHRVTGANAASGAEQEWFRTLPDA